MSSRKKELCLQKPMRRGSPVVGPERGHCGEGQMGGGEAGEVSKARPGRALWAMEELIKNWK